MLGLGVSGKLEIHPESIDTHAWHWPPLCSSAEMTTMSDTAATILSNQEICVFKQSLVNLAEPDHRFLISNNTEEFHVLLACSR